MPAFLKEIERFRGTGKLNHEGKSLEEFLESYDSKKYENPSNTVDNVVFAYKDTIEQVEDGLEILLIQRGNHPCIGCWALPGGFVDIRESLEDAAKRELFEETGVEATDIEQIYTWGAPDRDPRARIITTVYLALVKQEEVMIKSGDDASDAAWFQIRFYLKEKIQNEEKIQKKYKLVLKCKKKSVELNSEVWIEEKIGKLLKSPSFHIEDSGELSADHAAIITQALLYLERNIGKPIW